MLILRKNLFFSMKKILLHLVLISFYGAFSACGGGAQSQEAHQADTLPVVDSVPLPDTVMASVNNNMKWEVIVCDSTSDGALKNFSDPYQSPHNHIAFRANQLRDADFGGKVKGTPKEIVQDWVFQTPIDNTPTSLGVWGGGTGWTSQPLYVEWQEEMVKKFRNSPSARLTADFSPKEIVVASLCGQLCFINFHTGKASREPLDLGNPLKGTPMIDPRMNGLLYSGHALRAKADVCQNAVDLVTRSLVMQSPGNNPKAFRHWPGSDSSPIFADGFVFWPSENGLIYKYDMRADKGKVHSMLRYTCKGTGVAPGVESSMCVYKNYGYVGDNHGNVFCLNLNTMKPVWYYDNHDDIDASIVCEVLNGHPYVYVACEVDRQGDAGSCRFAKLDGLSGEPVWAIQVPCTKMTINKKHFDGGMYSTPLLGKGNCSQLIFSTLANDGTNGMGHFYAWDKRSGKQVYKVPLKCYSWSSPVAFYNENNELFIVLGDTSGRLYLIEGKSGKILFDKVFGANFESSPVVVGNSLVVGSRGSSVYKCHLQ